MWSVRADPGKNRLYLKLEGFLGTDELRDAGAKVLSEVKRLKSGFTLVNDISTFKPANDEGAAVIGEVQRAIASMGLTAVARVAPTALGRLQFERITKGAVSYDTVVVGSVAEADRALDARAHA